MHSQYPGPQPYQMQCGQSVNPNNYGQPDGRQMPSSCLHQQTISTLNQHRHSFQLGPDTPVASDLGRGSRGTSLADQNSVYSPSLSYLTSTSGSSSGYSMPLDSSQNFQGAPIQGALEQTTQIPSSASKQFWHTWNSSQTFLAKSTPGSFQSESIVDWHPQNHLQTNRNVMVMPVRTSQVLSGQPQTTGNNLDVNNSSIPEQTSLLPHHRCNRILDYIRKMPYAHKCCFTHFVQAMRERRRLLLDNINGFSHPTQISQLQQSCSQGQRAFNACCPCPSSQILQRILFIMKKRTLTCPRKQQQVIQAISKLRTEGHALQSTENICIPRQTNGQNVTQPSLPSSSKEWSNGHRVSSANYTQISRTNMTVTSCISSPTVNSAKAWSLQQKLEADLFKQETSGPSTQTEQTLAAGGTSLRKHTQPLSSDMMKSLSSEKSSEKGTCTAGQGVVETTTSFANSEPVVCLNSDSLNNRFKENKHTHKGQNIKEFSQSGVFFGMPIVKFSLGMLRKLVESLEEEERKKDESSMIENGLDLTHRLVDLYWDGSYHNYTESGLTFVNTLKEAAEFETEEYTIIFDFVEVEDLNQLQDKGVVLTSVFECDTASSEVDESLWRNVGDESLNIDKELADADFVREVCGSLMKQTTDTTSRHEDSLPLAKSDTVSLHSQNVIDKAVSGSADELGQNVTIPLTRRKNRQDDKESSESVSEICNEKAEEEDFSNQDLIHPKVPDGLMVPLMTIPQSSDELKTCPKEFREDSVAMPSTCCNGSDSEVELVEFSVNSKHEDIDPNECLFEECGRLSENLCETSEASNKDCPNDPDDSILFVKMSQKNEMKKADSEIVPQNIVNSSQKGSTTHTLVNESDQICPNSHMLSLNITMLSVDELKALSIESFEDSVDSVNTVAVCSTICDSSDDDDSEVQTCQTNGDLIQMPNQEALIISDTEEIPSCSSIQDVFKHSQIQTRRAEKKYDVHLINKTRIEYTYPLTASRKERDTQELQQHQQNDNGHLKLSQWPSIDQVQKALREESLSSPSATIMKKNSDVMNESKVLDTGEGHESSSHSSTLQSLPLKKRRIQSLCDVEDSVELTDALVPSSKSPLKVTKKRKNSQDHGADTELMGNERHRYTTADPPSGDSVLQWTGTSELHKSSGMCSKRKYAKLQLYGAQKVNRKDTRGRYCDPNVPTQLSIQISMDENTAGDKAMESYRDTFVPSPEKFRRLSSSDCPQLDGGKRGVNAPGKDKVEQQQTSGKNHQSERNSSEKGMEERREQSSEKNQKLKPKEKTVVKCLEHSRSSGKDKVKQQESFGKKHQSERNSSEKGMEERREQSSGKNQKLQYREKTAPNSPAHSRSSGENKVKKAMEEQREQSPEKNQKLKPKEKTVVKCLEHSRSSGKDKVKQQESFGKKHQSERNSSEKGMEERREQSSGKNQKLQYREKTAPNSPAHSRSSGENNVKKAMEEQREQSPEKNKKLKPKEKTVVKCLEHSRSSRKEEMEQQQSFSKNHQSEQKSSGRDKDERRQQSSAKKHWSKHKHRFSLNKLRREAERVGVSKKSPQEKQAMGLDIIRRYKRINQKV